MPGRPEVTPQPCADYGAGCFRRRILLRSETGAVHASLEDDFHEFRVWLQHDGEQVTAVEGQAGRFPWTTCPGAVAPLRRLEGMALSTSSRAVGRHTDPRAQCTHLFDLAGLAVAQALRGLGERRYEIQIRDRVRDRTEPLLRRDGREMLRWIVERERIIAPQPYAGRATHDPRFASWAEQTLEREVAEAAIVLRRACVISIGRLYDLDTVVEARHFHTMGASCHTFQPGVVEDARRMIGSTFPLSPRTGS